MDLICDAYTGDDSNDDEVLHSADLIDSRLIVLQRQYRRLQELHATYPSARHCLQAMTNVLSQEPYRSAGTQSTQDWQYFLQVLSNAVRSQRPTSSQPERLIGKRKRGDEDHHKENDLLDVQSHEATATSLWWMRNYTSHLNYTLWLCRDQLQTAEDVVCSLWFDYVTLHGDIWKYLVRSEISLQAADNILVETSTLVQATQRLRDLGMTSQLPTSRRLVDYVLATTKFKLEHESQDIEELIHYWKISTDHCVKVILPHVKGTRKLSKERVGMLYFIDGGAGDTEEAKSLLMSSIIYLIYMPLHFLIQYPHDLAKEFAILERLLRVIDVYGPASEDETLRLLSRSDVVLFSFLHQLLEIEQRLLQLQRTAVSDSHKHQITVLLASMMYGFSDSKRASQGIWLNSISLFLSLCGDAIFAYDSKSLMDIIIGPDTATIALSYFLLFFKVITLVDFRDVVKMKTTSAVATSVPAKPVTHYDANHQVKKVIIWHDQQVVNDTSPKFFRQEKIDREVWNVIDEDPSSPQSACSIVEQAYSSNNIELLIDLWDDVKEKLQDSFHKAMLPFNPQILCDRIETFQDDASEVCSSDDISI